MVSLRIEWHSALAAYTGAYVIAAAFALVALQTHTPLPVLRVVYYALVFALFWAIGHHGGLAGRAAVGCAAVGALLAWALNTASSVMGVSLGALAGGDMRATVLWIAGVGLGVLTAVLVGWGWRDRRWRALLGVAAVELVATVTVLVTFDRLLHAPDWVFSAAVFATSWDAALRLLVAWLLATLAFSWGLKFAVVSPESTNGD